MMGERLFKSAAFGRQPSFDELLDEDDRVRLKQAIQAWRSGRSRRSSPTIWWMMPGDPVLQQLRYRSMFNAADDPVKVVFHPQFVTATSPLISLDYDQFVRGCHMGIFRATTSPGDTPQWNAPPSACPQ